MYLQHNRSRVYTCARVCELASCSFPLGDEGGGSSYTCRLARGVIFDRRSDRMMIAFITIKSSLVPLIEYALKSRN